MLKRQSLFGHYKYITARVKNKIMWPIMLVRELLIKHLKLTFTLAEQTKIASTHDQSYNGRFIQSSVSVVRSVIIRISFMQKCNSFQWNTVSVNYFISSDQDQIIHFHWIFFSSSLIILSMQFFFSSVDWHKKDK